MKRFSIHKEIGGQAMTEFVIVFPSVMLLFLVIVQTALLMTAKQFVEYSAFCAARSAIVYDGNNNKIKRAANIACIPITPKLTQGSLREFAGYATSLGDMVITDLPALLRRHPELIGVVFAWDSIPGGEIINKLQNTDISKLFSANTARLVAGLLIIDGLCGAQGRVPQRYPAADLLTDIKVTKDSQYNRDVTVRVTHNYAMRVPVVNKLFFFAYLQGQLRKKIKARLAGLPPVVINTVVGATIDGLWNLGKASHTAGLYLMPIVADSTLTIEKEAKTIKNCK
jgi:hypothetical protein